MSYHFHSSLYRITKAVRIQPCHFWVSKKRLSYFLAAFPENHWFWPMWMYYWGGAVIIHKARLLSRVGGGEGASTHLWPTYNQTHAGSSFSYLRFAEAASFDKKELCRSDTLTHIEKLIFATASHLGVELCYRFTFRSWALLQIHVEKLSFATDSHSEVELCYRLTFRSWSLF